MRRRDWFSRSAAAILFVASRGQAETVVTAGAATGTWTKAGSPYLVMARVTFEDLTVEAGTIVRGAIGEVSSRITVSRSFVVTGTAEEPAVFETIGAGSITKTWEGIWPATFDVTGAIFRHANAAIFGGTPSTTSRVSRSRFEENNWAIDLRGNLVVDGVAFLGNNTVVFGEPASSQYDVSVTNATLVGGQGIIIPFQTANVSVKSSTFSSIVNPVASEQPSTISNSILSDASFVYTGQGTISVTHSTVWGASLPPSIVAGDGVARADPEFVSATDLHLRPTSPCIDSATAAGATDHDLDGNPRPIGLGFDRGAYEFSPDDGEGGTGASGGTAAGESGSAGTPTTGGAAGDGSGSSAGEAPSASGTASGGSTAAAAGGSDDAGATAGSKPSGASRRIETKACGCRAPGGEHSNGGGAALVMALAGLALLRGVDRRRRATRSGTPES